MLHPRLWTRGAGLLLALAALLFAGCLGGRPAVRPPREVPGRLAYLSGSDVWLWSDGSPPIRVTQDNRNLGPLWSPDGRWLLFIRRNERHGELWAVRADGTGLVPVAPEQQLPYAWTAYQWSPRGDAVAFMALADSGTYEVWVVPVGAGGPGVPGRVLTAPGGVRGFVWSPDGEALVVTTGSHRLIYPQKVSPFPAALLWVPATGGQARELLRWPQESVTPGNVPNWRVTELDVLTWSPDGRWLTTFGLPEAASLAADGVGLFLVAVPPDAPGAEPDPALPVRGLGTMLPHPKWVRWSPSGDRLAAVLGEGRSALRAKHLVLFDPAGSAGQPTLTPLGSVDRDPAWSPRGDRIAVSRAQAGSYAPDGPSETPRAAIWLLDPVQGPQAPLTDGTAGDFGPRWSAAGDSLLWLRIADAGASVWWSQLDGDLPAAPRQKIPAVDVPPGYYDAYDVGAVLSWYSGEDPIR